MTTLTVLPKAELHCHIEGAAAPDLVRRIAERNGVALPDSLFTADGRYVWNDFQSFLAAYDLASSVLRRPEDYRDIMYRYLADCAAEGAIYVEVFSSPDHAAAVGMSYADHLAGLIAAIDAAKAEFGITGRIIVTCVRHLGPDRTLEVARTMVSEPHPYVVGFGMGGDERQYDVADFLPAFRMAADAGYGCTVHAGEVAGPDSVREAITRLPVTRIGHGVRAAENPRLLDDLAKRGIVLEVCPGSNLALGLYPNAEAHPLRRLVEAGCRVTLNSDDPPFFGTSIGKEYADAASVFGLEAETLRRITETALDAAFVDDETRQELRQRAAQFAYQPTS